MRVLDRLAPRRRGWRVMIALACAFQADAWAGAAGASGQEVRDPATGVGALTAVGTLEDAQHHFYSGRYETAAEIAGALHAAAPGDLAPLELRTSALHFQLKRALGNGTDKDKAFRQCAPCPALRDTFMTETARGRTIAKAQVEENPRDPEALYFLGKLNLNYIWLQLGTIGKRTGWNEYWEARRSLDAALKLEPDHVRARIARAWIDYIVDTRMTRGFRWILGGGNKKRALAVVREAAAQANDPYARAEAGFARWEMELREKNREEAVAAARMLSVEFPENKELARFLNGQATTPETLQAE
jgi:hypothetical protein